MIVLNTTTQTLQVVLHGAVATNELPVRVSLSTRTTTYIGSPQLSETDGTTPVVICSAPASGEQIDIDNVNILNQDTASVIVTIFTDDNGTPYNEYTADLSIGDCCQYTHSDGWKVIDKYGNQKVSISTVTTVPLTASEVAYGDASNQMTSDSGFTRDYSTTDIAMNVRVNDVTIGDQTGSEAVVMKYDDGVSIISTLANGDLTGLGQAAFFSMLKIEDTINNFINLIKASADTWSVEIVDGTYTAGIHSSLSGSHLYFYNGVDTFEVGCDVTGIFLTALPVSASVNDQMVVWDNITGYMGYRALPTGTVTNVTATAPLTSSGGATPDISTSMATNKLIGRATAGTGVMEEITLGTGLSFSGTTLNASAAVTPAAMTKTDDTNVTLTLGGTPATSLLQAVSLTLGWTGTLADGRIASASTWNAKQTAYTILSTLGALANAAGVLTNDGAGALSWTTPLGGESLAQTLAIGNTTGQNDIILSNITADDYTLKIKSPASKATIQFWDDTADGWVEIRGSKTILLATNTGNGSYVNLTNDELQLNTNNGTLSKTIILNGAEMRFEGLATSSSTDDQMLVVDNVTNIVGYRAIPTGSDYTNVFLFGGM